MPTIAQEISPRRAATPSKSLRTASAKTSVGLVLVAATEKGVCAALLGDTIDELRTDLQRRFVGWTLVETDLRDDAELRGWVDAAVRAIDEPMTPPSEREYPLDPQGTEFQQRVWAELRKIPAGSTMTYMQIAERVGMENPAGSARAVGTACGANPIAVAVPCHRVLRGDGSLAGFYWGLERKAELLKRENAAVIQRGLW